MYLTKIGQLVNVRENFKSSLSDLKICRLICCVASSHQIMWRKYVYKIFKCFLPPLTYTFCKTSEHFCSQRSVFWLRTRCNSLGEPKQTSFQFVLGRQPSILHISLKWQKSDNSFLFTSGMCFCILRRSASRVPVIHTNPNVFNEARL